MIVRIFYNSQILTQDETDDYTLIIVVLFVEKYINLMITNFPNNITVFTATPVALLERLGY